MDWDDLEMEAEEQYEAEFEACLEHFVEQNKRDPNTKELKAIEAEARKNAPTVEDLYSSAIDSAMDYGEDR